MRTTMLIRGSVLTTLLAACGRSEEPKSTTSTGEVGSSAAAMIASDSQLVAMRREIARLDGLVMVGGTATPARRKELEEVSRRWAADREACAARADARDCLAASYARQVHEIRRSSPHARVDDKKGISVGPYEARCGGIESVVEVTFVNTTPGVLFLESADKSAVLAQVPSASGAKYERVDETGRVTFWNKGAEATFERPGSPPSTCTMTAIR